MLGLATNLLDVIYIPPEQFTEMQTAVPSVNQAVTSAAGTPGIVNIAIALIGVICFFAGLLCAAGMAVYVTKNRRKAEGEA